MRDFNNQFEKLRYKGNDKPAYTMEELQKAGIASKATISKYEKKKEDGAILPGFEALKAYKHFFNCSYEYLFGEASNPEPQYSALTDESVLGHLNGTAIDTLNKLLTDKDCGQYNAAFINALLTDSELLQTAIDKTIPYLLIISTKNKSKHAEEIIDTYKFWMYILDIFKIVLEHTIDERNKAYSEMKKCIDIYNNKEDERADEIIEEFERREAALKQVKNATVMKKI